MPAEEEGKGLSVELRRILTELRSAAKASSSEEVEVADPRAEAIDEAWRRSGVPKRYLGVPASKQPAGWAYITGPVGSGKTYGACTIIRRFLEDRTYRASDEFEFYLCPKAKFATVVGYLDAVKAHFADKSDCRARALSHADLLVLDDLGQEVPTQWAVEQLFLLINDRYNDGLPTVITSQFGIDAIASRLSEHGGREQAEAIASRLMGCCTAYRLTCGDRRIMAREGR